MNITEYGRVLTNIGQEIYNVSNNSEENLIQNFSNNMNLCDNAFHQLKNIQPPSFIMTEHVKLTDIFEQLFTAYSLQLNSINDERKVSNVKLFQKGKRIMDEEITKIGPILISILTKSCRLTVNNESKT